MVFSPTNHHQETQESRNGLERTNIRKSIESVLHSSFMNTSKLMVDDFDQQKNAGNYLASKYSKSASRRQATIELVSSDEDSERSL